MEQIPVIIDCDTGIDDILSLVLALSSKKLDVKAITTVAGNQTLEKTTYNTLNALELMNRREIPLAAGASKPLERSLLDAEYIHGKTGLGEYSFPVETDIKPVNKNAWEFMYEILEESQVPITIIALAPLTNIAKLILEYPDCKSKIKKIVFMGGSIRTGNPTPVSTFNVLVDPEAAKLILKSGIEFEMCPLDTTRFAYITDEEIESIRHIGNPVADMAYSVSKFYRQTTKHENNADKRLDGLSVHDLATVHENNADKRLDGLSVHDLATVMVVTNPEIFQSTRYYCDVETKGELTTGFTMIDYEDNLKKSEEEKNINFMHSIDREKFIDIFFEALNSYNS